MKIVITGYTGFLGKNLLDRFLNDNLLLIGRDHSLIDLIPKFNPDYIFHFGAEIYDDSKMMESNICFTHKMLEVSKEVNYKSFIYCGSSSEYGKKDNPMSETDVLVPRTMYEATKGAGTLLCQAYATTYNKPIATVRPFSVFGRYEKEHRFIPTLFRKFDNHDSIKISPGYHDFVYIDDFIDGVLSVAFSDPEKIKGEVVNLGTGVQYSNYELYDIMRSIYKYDIPLEKTDSLMRVFDTNNWVADISRARDNFGYNPKFNLREGLQEIYNERLNEKIK